MALGRPTSYKPEYADQAKALCEQGATDVDLADFFGVNVSTIFNWQRKHIDFLKALKAGKEYADDRVERSLYHKAIGYSYDAVKIFNASGTPMVVPYREHIPPDTTAAIFWLKNRRKEKWRDRHEHEVGRAGDFDKMTDDELEEFIAREKGSLSFGPEGEEVSRGKKRSRGKSSSLH